MSPTVHPGDEWPEAPSEAEYHSDEGWFGWSGHGWTISEPPPPPFPFHEHPIDHAKYGPPGTVWIFTVSDLLAEQVHLPGFAGVLAFNQAIKRWGVQVGSGPIDGWRVPHEDGQPGGVFMPMHWIRTAITGAIGEDEQMVHVINWRHTTQENAPIDNAGLKTFGDVVRTKWEDYMDSQAGGGGAIRSLMPNLAHYTEVRTSLLVQDAPATKPHWPLSTAVSPFGGRGVGSSASAPLPYEVALGISLNTNWRGTSRFRGRVYWGPLVPEIMGAAGQFNRLKSDSVCAAFGAVFMQGVQTATDYDLHIVSQKFGTSAAVIGVRAGGVPDSQRRRRRSRPEGYSQVYGAPVGSQ